MLNYCIPCIIGAAAGSADNRCSDGGDARQGGLHLDLPTNLYHHHYLVDPLLSLVLTCQMDYLMFQSIIVIILDVKMESLQAL